MQSLVERTAVSQNETTTDLLFRTGGWGLRCGCNFLVTYRDDYIFQNPKRVREDVYILKKRYPLRESAEKRSNFEKNLTLSERSNENLIQHFILKPL